MCKLKVRPVFVSKKLGEQLKICEKKPEFLTHRCDAGYARYTCQHLYQRVDEHKATVVGKHLKEMHEQDCTC